MPLDTQTACYTINNPGKLIVLKAVLSKPEISESTLAKVMNCGPENEILLRTFEVCRCDGAMDNCAVSKLGHEPVHEHLGFVGKRTRGLPNYAKAGKQVLKG